MIAFVDPFNRGLSHVPVNSGLLEAALLASPESSAVVAAEHEHLAGMLDLLDPGLRPRVKGTVAIDPPVPGIKFVGRLRADLANLRALMAHCDAGTTLIVGDLAPATLYALRIALAGRRRQFDRVAAVLHGNAAEIAGWRARNPLVRLTQLREAIRRAPRDTRFIVLESAIRQALIEAAPELSGRLHVIPHPLPLAEAHLPPPDGATTDRDKSARLKIAFVGAAHAKKGFAAFLTLAEKLTAQHSDAFEFHAIGWLPPESASLDMTCLSRQPTSRKIGRAEFVAALSGVDYVCMPYDPSLYRYSASGTLIDAIACGKPLIGLKSPMLEDLWRGFGDIGELAETMDDLCARTAALAVRPDPNRYRRQIEALATIAVSRSPKSLAGRWRGLWPDS